jgi:hypothetical protein
MRKSGVVLAIFVGGLVLAGAGQAAAGRFEEFTKKAAGGPGLKTLAATYFGGADNEEFVDAAGQSDGTVVAFGNAWGPTFPAAPAPTVLGKGKRYDCPETITDKKGRSVYDAANPNIAGMIVRYSGDLQKVLGVTRFDWGVASIETGMAAGDGSLFIAGRCTEAMPAPSTNTAAAIPSARLSAPRLK